MPKATLWIIGGALLLLFVILFRADTQPARVVIINQSGRAVREVAVGAVSVGRLGSGESRVVRVSGGAPLVITFRGERRQRWESPSAIAAGGAYVIAITPGDHVVQQRRGVER